MSRCEQCGREEGIDHVTVTSEPHLMCWRASVASSHRNPYGATIQDVLTDALDCMRAQRDRAWLAGVKAGLEVAAVRADYLVNADYSDIRDAIRAIDPATVKR